MTDLVDVRCAPLPGGTGWSCRVTVGGPGTPTTHEVTVTAVVDFTGASQALAATTLRAVTPGQSLVLYDLTGETVLGGATIQRRL